MMIIILSYDDHHITIQHKTHDISAGDTQICRNSHKIGSAGEPRIYRISHVIESAGDPRIYRNSRVFESAGDTRIYQLSQVCNNLCFSVFNNQKGFIMS